MVLDHPNDVVKEMEYYLAPLANYLNSITEEQRVEIRKSLGSGGKPRVWRDFQKVISEARPDFTPDGLAEWIRDNTKQYNVESFAMIQDLEHRLKTDFESKLNSKYGVDWITKGLPPKVYTQAHSNMGKINYENSIKDTDKIVSVWDCVTIANCRDIAIFGSNWTDLFEHSYTRPTELKLPGGKNSKTQWLIDLSKLTNTNTTNYSVSEVEFLFLKSLHEWLVGK